jgi:hypothetical protein
MKITALNKLSHPTLKDYGKMVLQNFVSAFRSSRNFKSKREPNINFKTLWF